MKYSKKFIKRTFENRSVFPVPHSVGGEKIPPDGTAQPRLDGGILDAGADDIPIGLSKKDGNFSPYVQFCGEGLPNSFCLDFYNDQVFSAGNLHPHTGLLLFSLALNARPLNIIETGTFYGYSTMYLAKALEIWGEGKVWTIDTNQELIHESIKNNRYVECVVGDSRKHIPNILEEIGEVQFAFIDSWKRIAYSEFKLIDPALPEGGVVVFHDTQFLNTGHSLYDKIMADHSDSYDTMFFAGKSHKDNPHKFFGNADDRGLFVLRKKNTDPFLDVKDYDSHAYGARLL